MNLKISGTSNNTCSEVQDHEGSCYKPSLFVLASSRHGQRKSGVEKAPKLLLTFCGEGKTVDAKLGDLFIEEEAAKDFTILSQNPNKILRPKAVSITNEELHNSIYNKGVEIIENETFPKVLTLGGDHSIAIGSVSAISNLVHSALKEELKVPFSSDELVVFWIDAHADLNTPLTTNSGNLHGCPVSVLAGVDADSWAQLPQFNWMKEKLAKLDRKVSSFINHKKLVYIGLRDVEESEQKYINELRIREYPMTKFKELKRNVPLIVEEALKAIDPDQKCPIHISFDIDGIDPQFAASTGTPVPDGLMVEEGIQIIKELQKTRRVISMDLVEVNPSLGTPEESNVTLATANKIITAFLD